MLQKLRVPGLQNRRCPMRIATRAPIHVHYTNPAPTNPQTRAHFRSVSRGNLPVHNAHSMAVVKTNDQLLQKATRLILSERASISVRTMQHSTPLKHWLKASKKPCMIATSHSCTFTETERHQIYDSQVT